MTNEALEEIRRMEAALPADLGRGGDFPTRNPLTGRWNGVTPPEQPTQRHAPAAPAAFASAGPPPSPRPAIGPRRRLPGQTLPTIQEIRAYDGYQLASSVGSLARAPAPTRRPPPPPIRQSPRRPVGQSASPPPPLPPRRPQPQPVPMPPRGVQQQQQQQQEREQGQQTPASAAPGEEDRSDASSDYGQSAGPPVQGNSTTNQLGRGRPRRSGLRGIFSGLRRGSQRLARPASRSAWEDQIDMWDVERYRVRSGGGQPSV